MRHTRSARVILGLVLVLFIAPFYYVSGSNQVLSVDPYYRNWSAVILFWPISNMGWEERKQKASEVTAEAYRKARNIKTNPQGAYGLSMEWFSLSFLVCGVVLIFSKKERLLYSLALLSTGIGWILLEIAGTMLGYLLMPKMLFGSVSSLAMASVLYLVLFASWLRLTRIGLHIWRVSTGKTESTGQSS